MQKESNTPRASIATGSAMLPDSASASWHSCASCTLRSIGPRWRDLHVCTYMQSRCREQWPCIWPVEL